MTLSLRPSHMRQPGPSPAERLVAVPCRGRALRLTLEAGRPLLRAIVDAFATEGFSSGTARLDGLVLAPFAYCMPALPRDERHVAFYSQTFRPEGASRFRTGAMTFGERDGAPFFHAHGIWQDADGSLHAGHVLPDETTVAETVVIDAFGIDGAAFRVDLDPETGFSLFGPVAAESRLAADGLEPAHALRLRPNRDFATALETFCRDRGIAAARLEGGVGSTIGALFTDGGEVTNFATEVFVEHGRIAAGADGPAVEAEIVLVDHTGARAAGRLVRGANPVLMTFELVVVETPAA